MEENLCSDCAWYEPITEHCYLHRLEGYEKILSRDPLIIEECLDYYPAIWRMIEYIREEPKDLPYYLSLTEDILGAFGIKHKILEGLEEQQTLDKESLEKILRQLEKVSKELPYGYPII